MSTLRATVELSVSNDPLLGGRSGTFNHQLREDIIDSGVIRLTTTQVNLTFTNVSSKQRCHLWLINQGSTLASTLSNCEYGKNVSGALVSLGYLQPSEDDFITIVSTAQVRARATEAGGACNLEYILTSL